MKGLEEYRESNREYLRKLMYEYYKDGEDKDTEDKIVYDFIDNIISMIKKENINCRLLKIKDCYSGFVLWFKDTVDHPFSQRPGFWSIAEIYVREEFRDRKLGHELVNYVEKSILKKEKGKIYINAYPPFQYFWKKMGYKETGSFDDNGLPIMIKDLY